MSEEPTQLTGSTADTQEDQSSSAGSRLRTVWILLIALYLSSLSIMFLWSFIDCWPYPANDPEVPLCLGMARNSEIRLIIVVALAGALGALVHGIRSLAWYVAKRKFEESWLLWYLMLPFVGSVLAFIFYVVIRAGFFAPGADVSQTSPYGFVALAGLVGMFSEQAVLKLKDVANTLLQEPPNEDDSESQDT